MKKKVDVILFPHPSPRRFRSAQKRTTYHRRKRRETTSILNFDKKKKRDLALLCLSGFASLRCALVTRLVYDHVMNSFILGCVPFKPACCRSGHWAFPLRGARQLRCESPNRIADFPRRLHDWPTFCNERDSNEEPHRHWFV